MINVKVKKRYAKCNKIVEIESEKVIRTTLHRIKNRIREKDSVR